MTTGGTGNEKGAPTFTITNSGTDIVDSKWSIHYVEYTIADTVENTITTTNPNILTSGKGTDKAVLFNPMGDEANWKVLKGRLYGADDDIQTKPFVWSPRYPTVATTATGYGTKRWFPVDIAEA